MGGSPISSFPPTTFHILVCYTLLFTLKSWLRNSLAMDETVSTATETKTEVDEGLKANEKFLMSQKPLHRFVQKQPRSFGILILMFGCAEVLIGFLLVGDDESTSFNIYVPFWEGTLFFICGVLSIYTELHPSKKMVTVCLAMYVIALLGILVSFGDRIYVLILYSHIRYGYRNYVTQLFIVEALLLTSSLIVFGFLTFLITIARFALKPTQQPIIVQHIVMGSQIEATTK